MTLLIDPAVHILEEGEVGSEEVLDYFRMDVCDRPQSGDDPGEQDNGQVRRLISNSIVMQRDEFVSGGSQSHDAVTVDCASGVDVSTR
jgi:hypothetical protein